MVSRSDHSDSETREWSDQRQTRHRVSGHPVKREIPVLGGLNPTRQDFNMGDPVVIGHGVPLYLHSGPTGLRHLQDGGCPRGPTVGLVPQAKLGAPPKNRNRTYGTWDTARAGAIYATHSLVAGLIIRPGIRRRATCTRSEPGRLANDKGLSRTPSRYQRRRQEQSTDGGVEGVL